MRLPALALLLALSTVASAASTLDPEGDATTTVLVLNGVQGSPEVPGACAAGGADILGVDLATDGNVLTVRLALVDPDAATLACGDQTFPAAHRRAVIFDAPGLYGHVHHEDAGASFALCLADGPEDPSPESCTYATPAFAVEEGAVVWTAWLPDAARGRDVTARAAASAFALHDPYVKHLPTVRVSDVTDAFPATL